MKKLTTNFIDADNKIFKYKRVIKLRMLYVKNLISWGLGIRNENSKPKPIFLNVIFKEEESWGVGEQEEYEDELRNKLSGYSKSLRNRIKELVEIFDTNETYESMDNVYKHIRSLLYDGYREFYIKCDNRSDAVAIQENIWSWVSESKVENINVKITFC